jgi:hypothetical protein
MLSLEQLVKGIFKAFPPYMNITKEKKRNRKEKRHKRASELHLPMFLTCAYAYTLHSEYVVTVYVYD